MRYERFFALSGTPSSRSVAVDTTASKSTRTWPRSRAKLTRLQGLLTESAGEPSDGSYPEPVQAELDRVSAEVESIIGAAREAARGLKRTRAAAEASKWREEADGDARRWRAEAENRAASGPTPPPPPSVF